MSINERIYRIEDLLKNRNSISFNELQEKLEISRATLKRDIAYMRDRLVCLFFFDLELVLVIEVSYFQVPVIGAGHQNVVVLDQRCHGDCVLLQRVLDYQ